MLECFYKLNYSVAFYSDTYIRMDHPVFRTIMKKKSYQTCRKHFLGVFYQREDIILNKSSNSYISIETSVNQLAGGLITKPYLKILPCANRKCLLLVHYQTMDVQSCFTLLDMLSYLLFYNNK